MELRQVYNKDLENIFNFCKENNWKIFGGKYNWKKILLSKWSNEDHLGYILIDDKSIIGVLLMLHSHQIINNELITVTNFSTWFVKKKCLDKNYSLELLKKASNYDNVFIVTTPRDDLVNLHKRFGFRYCKKLYRYIFFNSFNFFLNNNNDLKIKVINNENELNLEDIVNRKLISDHSNIANLTFLKLNLNEKYIIIAYKINYKYIFFPLAQLLYVEDYDLYFKFRNQINKYFILKKFCFFHSIFIDDAKFNPKRFFKKNKFNIWIKNNTNQEISYKINFLYSDFLLM